MNSKNLLLLQLSDSALPTGAFAHSLGLESAQQLKLFSSKDDLESYVQNLLYNVAALDLFFISKIYELKCEPKEVQKLAAFYSACVTNPSARRASLTQGKSLLMLSSRIFADLEFVDLEESRRWFTVTISVIFYKAGFTLEETKESFLFQTSRDIISAAIRLSLIGPIESVALQSRINNFISEKLLDLETEKPKITHPLVEVISSTHDKLKYKLFNS